MNEQQTPVFDESTTDDDVDPIIAHAKTAWNGRKTIIFSVILGAILGVAVALLSQKEYTVTTVMVPQVANDMTSKLGGLGGLAALAGFNIEDMMKSNELSPMIYPQIFGSVPFRVELMNTPLNFQDYPQPITLFDYYTNYSENSVSGTIKKYTIELPLVVLKAIKGKPKEIVLPKGLKNHLILLSDDQYEIIKELDKHMELRVNSKEGYLTMTIEMSEPLVSAQLAQKALELMQRYITEFKIEKSTTNLDFIQGRYNELKADFEKAQVSLATATDRNKNFTSGIPQIEIDRIQTRYTIALSIFQELAKQLEQAKIEVKKDTPVFTIVEPVTIPSLKDGKPSRLMTLIMWTFFGGLFGIGIIFGKGYFEGLKKKWKEH